MSRKMALWLHTETTARVTPKASEQSNANVWRSKLCHTSKDSSITSYPSFSFVTLITRSTLTRNKERSSTLPTLPFYLPSEKTASMFWICSQLTRHYGNASTLALKLLSAGCGTKDSLIWTSEIYPIFQTSSWCVECQKSALSKTSCAQHVKKANRPNHPSNRRHAHQLLLHFIYFIWICLALFLSNL